jgi:hypothetical protein
MNVMLHFPSVFLDATHVVPGNAATVPAGERPIIRPRRRNDDEESAEIASKIVKFRVNSSESSCWREWADALIHAGRGGRWRHAVRSGKGNFPAPRARSFASSFSFSGEGQVGAASAMQ